MVAILPCCYEDAQLVLDEELEEAETHEENTSSSTGVASVGSSKEEFEKPEFDSCPEDTYFLWEKDGIRYEITIPAFCEPIQDLNLGCPAPY
jgi:hypothetical protein